MVEDPAATQQEKARVPPVGSTPPRSTHQRSLRGKTGLNSIELLREDSRKDEGSATVDDPAATHREQEEAKGSPPPRGIPLHQRSLRGETGLNSVGDREVEGSAMAEDPAATQLEPEEAEEPRARPHQRSLRGERPHQRSLRGESGLHSIELLREDGASDGAWGRPQPLPTAENATPSKPQRGPKAFATRCADFVCAPLSVLMRAVVITAMSSLLSGYDQGVIAAAMLTMRDDLSLNGVQEELSIGIMNLAAALGGIAVAYVMFFAGSVVIAAAGGFPVLMSGRVAQGIGVGIALVVPPVLKAELVPANRRGGTLIIIIIINSFFLMMMVMMRRRI